MSSNLDIQRVITDIYCPSDEQFERWFNYCLPDVQVELTLRIVDIQEIRQLNADYRGKDTPTNVLSFPSELPDFVDSNLIGDIIISSQVVESEAKDQNKNLDAHWAHMFIHGLLHLRGFDHVHDEDAQVMEKLEVELLKGLGYADPYAEQD